MEKILGTELFHMLSGDKIYFKPLDTKDAPKIHKYASDKDVKRFIGWRLMLTLEETLAYVEEMIRRENAGTHLYASVVLKSTHEIVGTVMIFDFDKEANQAEVGYVFDKDQWGKGYGTEALALMTDFAFKTLNIHRLHASVVDTNFGSARILEKNGFMLEGRFRDHFFIDGRYYDGLFFGKLQA